MPAGGEITIAADNASLDEAVASAFPYRVQIGPYARIMITDNGRGMDTEILERVFEPFFTTRDPARGAGLGLSTVYGTIKQSGGYIWVDSTPGRGTTFEIFLPRHTESGGAATNPAPPAVETGGSTILLVEDEDVVRSVAHRILDRNGYRILEARNGTEALDIAETHEGTIHLLITDLTMPGMSGRELAERLAALRPDIRILFISGYTEDDDFRRSIDQLGAFLEKPFSPEALCNRVRRLLD
jgi:CheY-like chemotaxis protein